MSSKTRSPLARQRPASPPVQGLDPSRRKPPRAHPRHAPVTTEAPPRRLLRNSYRAGLSRLRCALRTELWERVVELAEAVGARQSRRASTTAVLAATLAFACPSSEAEALDLVARRELQEGQPAGAGQRTEHNVRLPRELRRRLDELAKSVRGAGFPGGRSALVNALLAQRLPADGNAAAEQLDQLRRARAAMFVRTGTKRDHA